MFHAKNGPQIKTRFGVDKRKLGYEVFAVSLTALSLCQRRQEVKCDAVCCSATSDTKEGPLSCLFRCKAYCWDLDWKRNGKLDRGTELRVGGEGLTTGCTVTTDDESLLMLHTPELEIRV